MDIEPGDLIIGVIMSVLGCLGLFMAAGATDDGISVFGLSLAGFATLFVLDLIRRHHDRRDAHRQRQSPERAGARLNMQRGRGHV